MSEYDQLNHEHTGKGIMCVHVLREERPLKEIWHLPDGTWDFMCDGDDHDGIDDAVVVCADCTWSLLAKNIGIEPFERGKVAEFQFDTRSWQIRKMTDTEIAECFEDN